mmetsp:Transcript_27806/g.42076  ORF Transcript_27806/g.42076 Transcript_27806/m.42076 type:complete len:468 (-) Transcript_27806:93-1496(-)|eukprot:CAMPEP_0178901978 /NCGR_PEP_ID=MMETSP0786-20121207/4345_1 /TAXON_ID=186022 /ORGANISM="Thalassionema frauenfeldii, Strain CCMP 1798" /LENGTH=467 /DNA_ID=CAMNT_0020573185 /DNA_START=63 /DNA_END=1466 /DNA_ORIENTATION=-
MKWRWNLIATLPMSTITIIFFWYGCSQRSQLVADAFSLLPAPHAAWTQQKQQRYYSFSRRKIKQLYSSPSWDEGDEGVAAVADLGDDDHSKDAQKNNTTNTIHYEKADGYVHLQPVDEKEDDISKISKKEQQQLPGEEAITNILSRAEVELVEALLVIVSTILVAISTIPHLDTAVYQSIETAQVFANYIFCIEFALRLYVNIRPTGIRKYLTKPLVLIDIVVIILPSILLLLPFSLRATLPSWCTSTGGLQNLRLLRILRLQRVLVDLETFANFQTALGFQAKSDTASGGVKSYQLQLARVVLSLFTLLSVATGLIYTAEHKVNPDIPDYFTALYFGLTTLTTVGFGDITPVTWEGKLVVCGAILAGVTVIPAQAALLVEALLEYEMEKTNGTKDGDGAATTLPAPAKSMRKLNNKENNQSININNGGLIDTITPCSTCGTTMHWSEAQFCWSCGAKLLKETDKNE